MPHAARHLRRAANKIERGLLHVPPSERDHPQQVAAAVAHLAQLWYAQREHHTQANNLDLLASRCEAPAKVSLPDFGRAGLFASQVNRHLPRRRVVKHQRA